MNRVIDLKRDKAETPDAGGVPVVRRDDVPVPRPPAPAVVHAKQAPRPEAPRERGVAWHSPIGRRGVVRWGFPAFIVVIVGFAAVGLFVYHNVMLPILLGLASLLLIVQRNRRPAAVPVAITDAAIVVDGTPHYHSDLASFWIEYQPNGIQELSLEFRKRHLPYAKIPLGAQNPVAVRNMLVRYLPEHQHPRSLADVLVHLLGL